MVWENGAASTELAEVKIWNRFVCSTFQLKSNIFKNPNSEKSVVFGTYSSGCLNYREATRQLRCIDYFWRRLYSFIRSEAWLTRYGPCFT